MTLQRIAVVLIAVGAAAGTLWLLGPQDCVTLGEPANSGPPCPNRFGIYLRYPLLWSLAVAAGGLVAILGWHVARRR